MRYFNTYGPVNEIEHYVVPRSKLVAELIGQIEQGKYFTIYAPRQMGKTTLLRSLQEGLEAEYLPITLSFEDFESLPVTDFLQTFWTELGQALLHTLQGHSHAQVADVAKKLAQRPATFPALRVSLQTLHQLLPDFRLVLIIDEFDAIPQAAIFPLLQSWQKIYLTSAPPRPIHSVILIGLQNIVALNLGRSSPFNIARELQLPTFTLEQTRFLLDQYPPESGQAFAEGLVEEIHRLTDGHPFLVNRLAAILTEEIATNRSQAISQANLSQAVEQLMRERNYNYYSLLRHAKEYEEQTLNVLFGQRFTFTLNTPWINELSMHGVIRQNEQGVCQIANPIYEQVLKDNFRPSQSPMQAAILVNSYDLRQLSVGNQLQMKAILSRFRQFVERRGREAFKVTPRPQEATGQYLLMAYLELVVRTLGGDLFTEVDSGEGRMDIIITHQGKRYIIETKIWRGQSYFDQGLPQLAQYLESEGESEGYLVVFHARPQVYGKLTYDELEFTLEHDGTPAQRSRKTIHVYLVRLGALFASKS